MLSDRDVFEGCRDLKKLLKEYQGVDLHYTRLIEIQLKTVDYSLTIDEDSAMMDLYWTCPILFNRLSIDDFYQLIMAFLLEKSVVFVSDSLEEVSACVLGLSALIRPFKWPHVSVPVLPTSLRYILDSPVPFILGLPGKPPIDIDAYPHILWVVLEKPTRIISDRSLQAEIALPYGGGLKRKIADYFGRFKDSQTPDTEKTTLVDQVVGLIRAFFAGFLAQVTKTTVNGDWRGAAAKFVSKAESKDREFFAHFFETQLFVSHVENLVSC
jgi:hypothetical protein